MEFQNRIDNKYKDRGGYQGLLEIYDQKIKYHDKLLKITDQYLIGYDQAKNWYSAIKRGRERGELQTSANDRNQ